MQLYDAKVRLNGKVQNEVPKTGITGAEVLVLKEIHGADAVVDVTAAAAEARSHDAERERLERVYGPKVVAKLFGAAHLDLPLRISGAAERPAPAVDAAQAAAVKSLLDT